MSSIFDLYLKDSIMSKCEEYFTNYLIKEGFEAEGLTEADRGLIESQIYTLLNAVEKTYNEHENENEGLLEITDKLISYCIIGKMNEARLCNVINELLDESE